jgi:vacuolar-type H+-ATPase catalytic subunit A/Vma1
VKNFEVACQNFYVTYSTYSCIFNKIIQKKYDKKKQSTTTQADALLQQEGSRILNVLVYVLMSSSGNFAGTAKFSIDCQNSSLDIVLQLSSRMTSSNERNSITVNIAKHKGLMVALLKYSANSEDAFRKATAKRTIRKLVPFM